MLLCVRGGGSNPTLKNLYVSKKSILFIFTFLKCYSTITKEKHFLENMYTPLLESAQALDEFQEAQA